MSKNNGFKIKVTKKEKPVLADETGKHKRNISRESLLWCLYQFGIHLFRMFGLNLLLTFCCCTVVLLPAAITGATRGMMMLLRGKGGLFWVEFKEEFRSHFGKKLFIWLMMMLLPVAVGFWASFLRLPSEAAETLIYVLMAVSLAVQTWFFTQLASLELSPGICLKNAVLMTILEIPTTLAILILYGAALAGVYFLYPYSIPVLISLLLAFIMIFVCQLCRKAFIRRKLYIEPTKEEAHDTAS